MDNTKMKAALEEVKSFGADYIGLQETKLNALHEVVKEGARRKVGLILKAKSVFTSNNDEYVGSYWKPGGMATLMMRQLNSKSNPNWTDPTSIIQRTRVNNQKVKLSIINVYLPKFKTGPTGTYYQTLNTIQKMKGWENAAEIKEYFYDTIQEKQKKISRTDIKQL